MTCVIKYEALHPAICVLQHIYYNEVKKLIKYIFHVRVHQRLPGEWLLYSDALAYLGSIIYISIPTTYENRYYKQNQ
jgi:hypothetical protein